MERFYFDLCKHGVVDVDDVGTLLNSSEDVRHEAVQSARQLMANDVLAGIAPDGHTFYVRNEAGLRVLSLKFSEAITPATTE